MKIERYEKPVIETLDAADVLEMLGPVQALSSGSGTPIRNVGPDSVLRSPFGNGPMQRR